MMQFDDAWLKEQHRRWLRHDAHRFVRPGYEHLLAPAGAGRKDAFEQPPLCARERLAMAAREAEAEVKSEAEFAAGLRRLRVEVAELRFALAMRRLALRARKYSPDQPRVPAGNPDGGQFTRVAQAGGIGGDDSQILSDATPDNFFAPGTRFAQNDNISRSVDLLEDEQFGGHTIARHVGKSAERLLNDVRSIVASARENGDFSQGLIAGSFPSLEAANKLVNSTLSRNQEKIDRVTKGISLYEQLDARFGSPTGYEAYAPTERSQPYIRNTNGVRVIIVPDRRMSKGYRVLTAFPRNLDR